MSLNWNWNWNWNAITAIAGAALALATATAVCLAWWQIRDAVAARRAQNYLELRKEFLAIDRGLDSVDNPMKEYQGDDQSAAWDALKRYWYFTETEWTVAKLDKFEESDWRQTVPQVVYALNQPAFRSALSAMSCTRFSKGQGKEFVEELTRDYEAEEHKPLRLPQIPRLKGKCAR